MLYTKYLKMQYKSSSQYLFNLMLISFSQVVVNIGDVLAIWLLFVRFDTVAGWTFYETLLLYSITYVSFSTAECFARGYDEFPSLIKNGQLDRFMIRPVNIHYQIFGSKIEFSKLSRLIFGIVLFIISITNINVDWNISKVIVLLATFICGIVVIFSLFVLAAGISIYTIEKLEFVNIITDGSKELAYYPINIYKKWLTNFFTFIIPIACFNYLPLSYILGIGSLPAWLCAISPFIGMLFVIPCIIFFNLSLRKYQSSGT